MQLSISQGPELERNRVIQILLIREILSYIQNCL